MTVRRLVAAVIVIVTIACLAGCGEDEAELAEPTVAGTHHAAAGLPKGREMIYPVPGREPQGMTMIGPTKGVANLHRAVILIHGGGWVSGGRHEMDDIGRFFANDGFTAVSIDYTLARPGQRWPAQLLDVQAAARFVRSHAKEFDFDAEQIAAAGISAGGHLSMWLGVSDAPVQGVSSRVQAVGSISGVLDLNQPLTTEGERYHIVEQLLSDDARPTTEQRQAASPVTKLGKDSPPMFFIQGKNDPLVPASQSTDAEAALTRLGVPTDLILVDGMGHGLTPSNPEQKKALAAMSTWLKPILKVGH